MYFQEMVQCNIAVFKKINWGVCTNIYKNVPIFARLKSVSCLA